MMNDTVFVPRMDVLNHTVLLVDDSTVNLSVLADGLEVAGLEVLVAQDGLEALQRIALALPDLILLDVMMPGMDGFEVCRHLKAQPHTCDIPVIFMTSLSATADKVKGFAAGAVDYVTKPFQIEEVRARVRMHLEIRDLKQRLEERIAVQADYLDQVDQEQRMASGYMNRLIALDTLKDSAVDFYLRPARNFSGDLIAMARTPDGRLHLLLADSTGHGLSAVLAAMPVTHPFYSMTEKGFGIAAIAREINGKVRQVLPVSHFVAAILVSIDADAQLVEVWSGGCPPPVLLDAEGGVAHRFRPRHLAMGILPAEQFDASLEYFSYDKAGYSLLMFSDGVIEQEVEHGEFFGLERLLAAAASACNWQDLVAAVSRHREDELADADDVAMMLARCEMRGKIAVKEESSRRGAQGGSEGHIVWQFALTLAMEQLRHLDVVPLLLDILQQIELDKAQNGQIFLVLSEMFNNALDHGVLKLDSRMKQHADGMEQYFEKRVMRLAEAERGTIHMHLKKILREDGGMFLRIRMKDSGDGFDYPHYSGQADAGAQRHGRGIALMRHVCSSVQFLGNGSEVMVEMDIAKGAAL